MYHKILVGYDESERGEDALALARTLAEPQSAELVLGRVLPFDPGWPVDSPSLRDLDANAIALLERTPGIRGVYAVRAAYPAADSVAGPGAASRPLPSLGRFRGHGVTIALAFRAYLTDRHLLPQLLTIDGLPEDLRATLRRRMG